MRRFGFTMIELLLVMTMMSLIIVGGYYSFTVATRVWRTGTDAADAIHHADFVMEQVSMALRSAYYPDNSTPDGTYGMVIVSDGDGEESHDQLSWVKMGNALVGSDSEVANSPHRIILYSVPAGESNEKGFEDGGIAIKAWNITALPEDFDPEDEEYVKPMMLAPGVIGLDIKVLDPENNLEKGRAPMAVSAEDFNEDDPFEWIDEDWKDDYTNRLPYAVQATLYLPPVEDDEDPIAVSRVITLPLAPLSWRDKGAAGGGKSVGRAPRSGATKSKQSSQ